MALWLGTPAVTEGNKRAGLSLRLCVTERASPAARPVARPPHDCIAGTTHGVRKCVLRFTVPGSAAG